MNGNPFWSQSALNSALRKELCQQIHYEAVRAATRGRYPENVPAHISIMRLQQSARMQGQDVCIWHPADLDQVFEGVTLAVYQTIESLYCSRLAAAYRWFRGSST